MDDGNAGEFRTIFITSDVTFFVATEGIMRGKTYRFRYRVRNLQGWSPFSEIGFITAFSIPSTPPAPQFVSATGTSVSISMQYSSDDNGSRIALYELWIDAGNDLSSAFRKITTYDGITKYHTLTTADDSLGAPGTIYRIKYRAKNLDNQYSEFSKNMIFALGSVPSPPSTPVKDDDLSSNISIALHWNKITTDVLPVIGYKLYADLGHDDDFKLVFDGTNYPEAVSFNFTRQDLNTSLTYRFYVTGVNFNGEGVKSATAYHKPCTRPIFLERA